MIGLSASLAGGSPWRHAAVGGALPAFCLFMLLAATIGLVWSALLLRRLRGEPCSLARDQRGTATLEFALAAPLLLFFALLLVQTMLVATGNIYIHYAAFAAARSAIVTIPDDIDAEPANEVRYPDSTKHERIRRAAVLALLPVGGDLDANVAPIDTLAPQIHHGLSIHYGPDAPVWLDRAVASRYRYADVNTRVTLLRLHPGEVEQAVLVPVNPEQAGRHTFGPAEPVGVLVRHRFSLKVPIASAIFAGYGDGEYTHTEATGRGLYRWIEARSVLTNEGTQPELPDAPRYWNPETQSWDDLQRTTPRDRR